MEQREVLTVHALSVLSCFPTGSVHKSKLHPMTKEANKLTIVLALKIAQCENLMILN